MMEMKISDFLNEYCTDIPESTKNGSVFRLTYSEDMKHISFFALFQNIVPTKDIFLFESSVSKAIGTESINLNPRYDKSLFIPECIPELIELLKRDISVVNGFLNDADIRLDGDDLNIKLMHGGYDILKRCKFNSAFSQLIYNQFGIKINIKLYGENTVNTEEYNEMVNKCNAEMPDYSSQLIPEKSKQEIQREEVLASTPTQSIDITSLNKEFDAESAEIVKGKAIREKPSAIADVINQLGTNVVVIGDIFSFEVKELKNDKSVILIV